LIETGFDLIRGKIRSPSPSTIQAKADPPLGANAASPRASFVVAREAFATAAPTLFAACAKAIVDISAPHLRAVGEDRRRI
jgi:hypothetical protein